MPLIIVGVIIAMRYTKLVSFPAEQEERDSWIKAMPNDPHTLVNRSDMWICASHFLIVCGKLFEEVNGTRNHHQYFLEFQGHVLRRYTNLRVASYELRVTSYEFLRV